jgi:hypothetical protein
MSWKEVLKINPYSLIGDPPEGPPKTNKKYSWNDFKSIVDDAVKEVRQGTHSHMIISMYWAQVRPPTFRRDLNEPIWTQSDMDNFKQSLENMKQQAKKRGELI